MRPRIIVDTSVLIAALLSRTPGAPSGAILAALIRRELEGIGSQELVEEYRAITGRADIGRRTRLTPAELEDYVLGVIRATNVADAAASLPLPPDPGDAHVWALLAANGDAVLVTRDRALLEAAEPPGPVMTPAEFVERYLAEE